MIKGSAMPAFPSNLAGKAKRQQPLSSGEPSFWEWRLIQFSQWNFMFIGNIENGKIVLCVCVYSSSRKMRSKKQSVTWVQGRGWKSYMLNPSYDDSDDLLSSSLRMLSFILLLLGSSENEWLEINQWLQALSWVRSACGQEGREGEGRKVGSITDQTLISRSNCAFSCHPMCLGSSRIVVCSKPFWGVCQKWGTNHSSMK